MLSLRTSQVAHQDGVYRGFVKWLRVLLLGALLLQKLSVHTQKKLEHDLNLNCSALDEMQVHCRATQSIKFTRVPESCLYITKRIEISNRILFCRVSYANCVVVRRTCDAVFKQCELQKKTLLKTLYLSDFLQPYLRLTWTCLLVRSSMTNTSKFTVEFRFDNLYRVGHLSIHFPKYFSSRS